MALICKKGKLEKKFLDNGFRYDVCRGEKREKNLRYDFTLIYPAPAKPELPRTFGHYHSKGQAELFEVLSGKALFFIQRYKKNPKIIEEAYLIEAGKKDKVVILPDFSVTSINSEKRKKLLLLNWINNAVKNEYENFKKLGGNCYRIIRNEKEEIISEKNINYKKIPKLIKLKPKKLPKELENLDFLNNPEKYKKILNIENCYKKIP